MRVQELFDLSGRTAIVTGGARGLGRQACLGLAEAGAGVAICDLLEIEGERTCQEMRAFGQPSHFGRVDVTSPGQIETFVQSVMTAFGKIDILVNNAWMPSQGCSLEEQDDEGWRLMLETNLSGMFYFGKAVEKRMIDLGKGGVISNITPRHNVPYCVAKGGVAQLTRGMASDWAPYNIRANAIAPRYMLTEQTAKSRTYPEIMERLINNTPMKHCG